MIDVSELVRQLREVSPKCKCPACMLQRDAADVLEAQAKDIAMSVDVSGLIERLLAYQPSVIAQAKVCGEAAKALRELANDRGELIKALRVARQWMPVGPYYEGTSQLDCEAVDRLLAGCAGSSPKER